jgi:hypothetical protein
VDGLDHGSDLVLADGPQRLEALGREELKVAELAHLDVVRPVVGPDEVLAVAAEPLRGAIPGAVGELLVVLLEHLPRQVRGGHNHREAGAEPDGDDGPVPLRPLLEAAAPHGLDLPQVAHHGPGTRAWRQAADAQTVQQRQRERDRHQRDGDGEEEGSVHGACSAVGGGWWWSGNGGTVLGELIGRESRDQREIRERLAVGEWDPPSFPFLSSFFHSFSDPHWRSKFRYIF